MRPHSISCGLSSNQHGVALYVALIMLVVLSLFGVVAANTAVVENRMASATRNLQLARLAASSAMNEGRIRVVNIAKAQGSTRVCAELTCLVRSADAPEDPRDFMQTAAAVQATIPYRFDFTTLEGEEESARLARNPGYVIEDLGAQASASGAPPDPALPAPLPKHVFRITAIGTGAVKEFQYAMEDIQVVDE